MATLCSNPALDPYPEGYLARLAEAGVNGVWLQGILSQLAPAPWDQANPVEVATRLRTLNTLVQRARRHGIGLYLYLNEPRSKPLSFFAGEPGLKGVTEGDYAALCTSEPRVRDVPPRWDQKHLREGS